MRGHGRRIQSSRGFVLMVALTGGLLSTTAADRAFANRLCTTPADATPSEEGIVQEPLSAIARWLSKIDVEFSPSVESVERIDRSDRGYLVAFRRAPREADAVRPRRRCEPQPS